jgi:hypothetical protein
MKDLETFKALFNSDRVKAIPNGLLYRSKNLDAQKLQAMHTIERHGLSLIVRCSGDMAAYGGFEVMIKEGYV